jgi:glutathione S-transferase
LIIVRISTKNNWAKNEAMELYFVPMACSLATRIVLYEIGEGERTCFHRVKLTTKLLEDGSDYHAINPEG